ncbi:hypothetical protein SAMN00120144_1662 [Hymenobacter roseosalivarius DSM 11622]|uniref:Type II secretion system protein GspG C-terminal domain-containing protein n=1 Tax=Hymenobacter roseosalivarius DSM 11622 TaxID=645990 RepID=A0A1W1W3N0_9BACT|nr:hypothetical protein SAMN00120144_1662 [Hymenobacter roseosalivarius DSM 11622]
MLAIMLCLHTQASEPLLSGIQWFLSLFALVLYVLLWGFGSSEIAVMLRRFLGAAVVATFLSVSFMIPIYRWQNALTKRQADTVIQQVYAYQKQHGHYPESLEQLVPRHLDKIPSTAQGLLHTRSFTYTVSAAKEPLGHMFWLRYYSGALVDVTYNSKPRQWHAED